MQWAGQIHRRRGKICKPSRKRSHQNHGNPFFSSGLLLRMFSMQQLANIGTIRLFSYILHILDVKFVLDSPCSSSAVYTKLYIYWRNVNIFVVFLLHSLSINWKLRCVCVCVCAALRNKFDRWYGRPSGLHLPESSLAMQRPGYLWTVTLHYPLRLSSRYTSSSWRLDRKWLCEEPSLTC